MKAKTNFKKAFTMAEAILVMTILGVIAAIMLSTLKPTKWKDESYKVLAKKVLYEIDTATTNILTTNSKYGNMGSLVSDAGGDYTLSTANLWVLYKKYLSTVREGADTYCKTGAISGKTFSAHKLKDGACFGIYVGNIANQATIFPEETATKTTASASGYFVFDTNDKSQPNVVGKDRFIIPFDDGGIKYE